MVRWWDRGGGSGTGGGRVVVFEKGSTSDWNGCVASRLRLFGNATWSRP